MVETKKGNGCGRSKPFGFLSFGPKKNAMLNTGFFLGGSEMPKKELAKCRKSFVSGVSKTCKNLEIRKLSVSNFRNCHFLETFHATGSFYTLE